MLEDTIEMDISKVLVIYVKNSKSPGNAVQVKVHWNVHLDAVSMN